MSGPWPLVSRAVMFVGAFDPMHDAHLQKAAAAARVVGGTCIVMPIAEIPHKAQAADIAIRMEIIRAQIATLPETHPDYQTGAPVGVQVVEETPELHSENYMFVLGSKAGGKVYSLVGRDSFNAIALLACASDILNHTTPIVVARDGYDLDDVESVTSGLATYEIAKQLDPSLDFTVPAVEALAAWDNVASPQHQLIHASMGDLTMSSQQLRAEIARGTDLAAYFADETARALVRDHYQTPRTR